MRLAVLYYLVQTWTADRYGRAKRDKPGPCREPGPPHASTPRHHRVRKLLAVVAFCAGRAGWGQPMTA